MVNDHHAAEDACQATFLVLARRAASLRSAEPLAGWLYGVACRVALKARTTERRRAQHAVRPLTEDPASPQSDPLEAVSVRELLNLIDEEVSCLPEVYRLPVLLCCFEGHTQEEAARRLGWTPGSLQGRLERGRKRLHERLVRRGFTLAAALAVVEASRPIATALPAALVSSTIDAAAAVSAAQPVAPGVVSAPVIALAEGVLKTMLMRRIKNVLAAMLLAAMMIAGVGVLLSRQIAAAKPGDDKPIGAGKLPAPRGERPGFETVWKEKHAFTPQADRADQVFCARFSPSGKLIACGLSYNGKLLDAETGEEKAVLAYNHPTQCAFSPDGKTLAAGHLDGLHLWDPENGKLLGTLDGKTMNVSQVVFTHDGKLLLSAETNTVRLWDLAARKEIRRFNRGDADTRVVYSAAFSPDEKYVATAEGPDKLVTIWDVKSGKEVRTLTGFKGMATAVAFSPEEKILASSDGAGLVRLWDAKTGKSLAKLKGPIGGGGSLAFSPDGKTLASVGVERRNGKPSVRVWDVASRKEIATLKNHTRNLWTVAFSHDGKRMVTAGDDAVRVWQAERQPMK
jgi:RNA polymerase sigma factor (sigma-70 family)